MTPSQSRQHALRAAATALLYALLTGCGAGTPSAHPSPSPSPSPSTETSAAPGSPTTTPAPSPGLSPGPPASTTDSARVPVTKLLVFVVENHSLDAMRRQMPYTYGLARRYGYATGYRAITHPSLPNYLAISGGDTFGVGDDRDPSVHPVRAPSVFGEALAHHHTAKVYADAMAGTCATSSQGEYAVRHNPWTYHVGERTLCRQLDVPLGQFPADVQAGRLPDAGMVVPNLCHDAHDCPAATADTWLRRTVRGVLSGPDFTSGRLLVVITADEDDHTQGNLVLTTLVNPQLRHVVVRRPLDHYSLSRLYSEVLGEKPLRRARAARSMVRAFGLVAGPGQ
jgi:phosphatidylinositol-3-phosphatase